MDPRFQFPWSRISAGSFALSCENGSHVAQPLPRLRPHDPVPVPLSGCVRARAGSRGEARRRSEGRACRCEAWRCEAWRRHAGRRAPEGFPEARRAARTARQGIRPARRLRAPRAAQLEVDPHARPRREREAHLEDEQPAGWRGLLPPERPPLALRPGRFESALPRWRYRRAHPGARLGRQGRVELRPRQRSAHAAPRRFAVAERQYAHDRVGVPLEGGGDRARPHGGILQQGGSLVRRADRGEAFPARRRRGRLDVAQLGSPRAGPGSEAAGLRKDRRARRKHRHQRRLSQPAQGRDGGRAREEGEVGARDEAPRLRGR